MSLNRQNSCNAGQALCILMVALGSLLIVDQAEGADAYGRKGLENYERWDPETVKLFGSLPVLEEGRLKPIETVARYKLLRMNSSKSLRAELDNGEKIKISATEWIMDCLFRPELAKEIPLFKVNNPGALFV